MISDTILFGNYIMPTEEHSKNALVVSVNQILMTRF